MNEAERGRATALLDDVRPRGRNYLAPLRLGSTTQNWLDKSQYSADPTFNGLIDDFRIYRGAMTAAQIVSLMNS